MWQQLGGANKDWEGANSGQSERCRHYLVNGGCKRVEHFMCGEWLKHNPQHAPEPSAEDAPPTERMQHQLFDEPEPVPPKPAKTSAPARTSAPVVLSPSNPPVDGLAGIRCLTEKDIESFKTLGVEACFATKDFGELWLVPEYTGQDRKELSVEHAMLLVAVSGVFPEATLKSFGPRSDFCPI
ncbi:MAG: hypothetical protein AB7S68_36430 [Polyangiaceae bacterium]